MPMLIDELTRTKITPKAQPRMTKHVETPLIVCTQAEDKLREAMYREAFPDSNATGGPAQVLHELLQQPFSDLQLAVYRLAAPLCCRDWFAADVCLHGDLLEHLLDPSTGPAALCRWRHAVVLCLAHVAAEAHARQQAGEKDLASDATLSKQHDKLYRAAQGGAYGEARSGAQHDAAIPAVADVTG